MTRILRGLGAAACLVACASTANAIVPDAILSVTPECIRVAPDGAFPIDVTVIGNDGNPLGGDEVRVIFSASCVDLVDVSAGCAQPTVLSGITNGAGEISFSPEIGGCCDEAGAVTIEADPGAVTLIPVYDNVGSNDNNSTGDSTLPDFVIFQSNFLANDSCNDLADCNENVGLADFVVFQANFLTGAGCP
jgi:hypothetical protein